MRVFLLCGRVYWFVWIREECLSAWSMLGRYVRLGPLVGRDGVMGMVWRGLWVGVGTGLGRVVLGAWGNELEYSPRVGIVISYINLFNVIGYTQLGNMVLK